LDEEYHLIEQMGRSDDERAPFELLGKQGRHVGLAQADDIGQEQTAILFQDPAGVKNGFFLVLQPLEAVGHQDVVEFIRPIQHVAEGLVEELVIKLLRREMSIRRPVFKGVPIGLGNVDGHCP